MSETYTPDSLFGGAVMPVPSRGETLLMGAAVLPRGTVLGKVKRALGDVDPDPGNTGEGGITGAALGAKGKVGTYRIVCVAAGPPSIWQVIDPDGNRLADAEAEVPYVGPIRFLISAYGHAFAVDDLFTFDVDEGSGYVTPCYSGNLDGSEDIYGILAEETDPTAASVPCPVYLGGEYSEAALTFQFGDDADTHREAARALGILFRTNIAAV